MVLPLRSTAEMAEHDPTRRRGASRTLLALDSRGRGLAILLARTPLHTGRK